MSQSFTILQQNGISHKKIKEQFSINLMNPTFVEKVFANNGKEVFRYMKLTDKYNKVLSKEELEEIAKEKSMTVEEIINQYNIDFAELLLENLNEKGSIYIGENTKIQSDMLNQHGEKLLIISKKIARKINYVYGRYTNYNFDDMQSYILEVMIDKCGGILYNLDHNINIAYACISKKATRYCKYYIFDNIIHTNKIENIKYFDNNDELDLNDWQINQMEEQILEVISKHLEQGKEPIESFSLASAELNITLEELQYYIRKIKNKNIQKSKDREIKNEEIIAIKDIEGK